MGVRFIHAADIHLGYEQYHSTERYNDFARAFQWLTDQALARRVEFVLVAGDLFHKHSIDPRALLQASRQLERLRAAHIPAIAVQGNHEQPHYQDNFSWLDYLAHSDLLTLLSPSYADGRLVLAQWDQVKRKGAYIDLPCGVRVMGVAYSGASTPRLVQDLTEALAASPGPRSRYTILMLHAGLEGILPGYAAVLTRAQLDPLHEYTNYLALGHIHKPFEQDDWIYNPGSLETTSTDEAVWRDRGYYLVEIGAGSQLRHHAQRMAGPRRPFRRFALTVDPYLTPEALYQAADNLVAGEARPADGPEQPVVELQLTGVLSFSHASLDTARLETSISQSLNPLVWRLKDESTAPGELPPVAEGLSSSELERRVLCDLAERDLRYRGRGAQWAEMILEVKKMALARSAPELILAELSGFSAALDQEDSSC
jgi:DNA repair exonuclease SbcCD nuclease subunit